MAKPKFVTEEQVNDYYDERRFKIENSYYSRVRDIDSKIVEIDELTSEKRNDIYDANADLAQQRDRLMDEYARGSEGIFQMEQELEIKRNRYQLLDTQFTQTEDPAERENIRNEAVQVGAEIQDLKSKIGTAQRQDFQRKQETWDEVQKVNQKILANNKKLEKLSGLEEKQNALVSKRDELAEKFDSDIQRNEQLRQQALDKLPKTVPDRVVDVDGYGWTDYCDGGRIITVPIKFSVRLPEDLSIKDIPQDILQQMALDALAYLIDEGENVPGGFMLWSDTKPTGAGDYHFGDRGIAYSRTEVIEPEYDGYTLTPEGYIKTK